MSNHESLAYLEDELEDEDLSGYGWGFTELFCDSDENGSVYYIVRDGGCSCGRPGYEYGKVDACFGPFADFGELVADVKGQPAHYREVVYLAAKKNADGMLEALKKELEL